MPFIESSINPKLRAPAGTCDVAGGGACASVGRTIFDYLEQRHIDWKVYARSDRYYIKKFEEETNLDCHLMLDVSGSMGYGSHHGMSKFEYGACLAASLGYLMNRQRDAVGLTAFDENIVSMLPASSRPGHLLSLLVTLDRLKTAHRTDVSKPLHQLADTLTKLSDDRVKIRIIHSGVGAINESDVLLGAASNAIIIGFNVRPDRNAADVADRDGVDIRLHSVIYNVVDEMKKAMSGLLDPTFKEVRIGVAQVRETFKTPKFGTIAGCMVTEGTIKRSGDAQARLLRDNVVVYEGKIGSLRRFKDDVSEVKSGFECGIGIDRFTDLKVGDVIEVFVVEKVAATA